MSGDYEATGFVVIREFLPATFGWGLLEDAVDLVNRIAAGFETPFIVMPEANLAPSGHRPPHYVAKIFRVHRHGAFRRFAQCEALSGIVAQLIGPDVDCWPR